MPAYLHDGLGEIMTKYLIINDEHELYDVMYADLYRTNEYDIEEISRFIPMPSVLEKIRSIHFDDRINRHLWLPGKCIWNRWYMLDRYPYDVEEQYWVLFLNGTLRNYYSASYLRRFKQRHANVRLAMVMYDSYSNKHASRAIELMPLFDKVFSFDELDCRKHGLEFFYATMSKPSFIKYDESFHNGAFFVGAAEGRLPLMEKCFSTIAQVAPNCRFNVVGVPREDQRCRYINYNAGMSYKTALQYSYNSDLIVEILRDGQTGVSLRTCEAILFNKKLLTNNEHIKEMPFYDPRFMSVFKTGDDIDLDFVRKPMDVKYPDDTWFSPLRIIQQLDKESKCGN